MNIEVKVEKQFGEHKKGKTLVMHKSTAEALVKKGLVSLPAAVKKALEEDDKSTAEQVKDQLAKIAKDAKDAQEAKQKKAKEAEAKLAAEKKEAEKVAKDALAKNEADAKERAKKIEVEKALALEKAKKDA
jgi:colicin import membrane protein